jgi:hypothetical protein
MSVNYGFAAGINHDRLFAGVAALEEKGRIAAVVIPCAAGAAKRRPADTGSQNTQT